MLEMTNIRKTFPGVVALDNVSFDLYAGEVHALLGENGAGKSTLMKVLFGLYRKDSGGLVVRGRDFEPRGPRDSYAAGIRLIPQELSLVPSLTVAENISAGQLPVRNRWFVDWREVTNRAAITLGQLGLTDIGFCTRVSDLPLSEQQMVAIARALQSSPSVIVFDEPTSALGRAETRNLFAIIRRLKSQGLGIIYITHRLEEVPEIADRVTVMRDGKVVATAPARDASMSWIIDHTTGVSAKERYPRIDHDVSDEIVLEVRHISLRNRVNDVSFRVHRGEILGITGFVGAGKSEVARIVFGAEMPDAGEVWLNGHRVRLRNPGHAIKSGIALIPEDRRRDGLVLSRRVYENLTLPTIREVTRRFGVLDTKKELEITAHYIRELSIVTPTPKQRVRYLSGGNQQKIVVSKWLNAEAKLFVFDEATRGIDVGAKAEIYRLMGILAQRGAAVITISMEFPEVLAICDRILVMREGGIAAEVTRDQATIEGLYEAAGGGGLSD